MMTGQQIKDRLERDLGFETNRARMLAEDTAAAEISIYWRGRNLPAQRNQIFSSLAKASLVAGLAGRQKLTDLLFKTLPTVPKGVEIPEIANEITALVLDYQSTLNLSRHRASCVNAHLNVLEPDRTLTQIYSAHLADMQLKRAKKDSSNLLKREITSDSLLHQWLTDVNDLLAWVSEDAQAVVETSDESAPDGATRKGLISRKAMPTYLKQWELFVREKLGPSFGVAITESDVSPLSGKLNNLEQGSSRSWTTIACDITEMQTSTAYQRRIASPTTRGLTTDFASPNLDNFELDMNGRPLHIQLSPKGITRDHVAQFSKAMKAQFLVYKGKGAFNVSSNTSGMIITLSLSNATRADLKKIEEVILQLI